MEESLESLKSLNSLESQGNGQILLSFPSLGGVSRSLESLNSLESLDSRKWTFLKRPLFQKTPFSEPDYRRGQLGMSTFQGPNIEKIQDRSPGLKFSIEIQNFKRATQQTPIIVANSEGPRLKFSIEIEIFNRD